MEYIYIIQQTCGNPFDITGSCIMSAHKSEQDAEKALKRYYEEDVKWLLEEYDDLSEEDFEDNDLNSTSSIVRYGNYWSSNEIFKKILQ